jgi:outer membrane protein assembly factor BamD (BamD/ComL family)
MSTAVWTTRLELSSVADKSLKAATRFWFAVTLIGQFAFAFSVAIFYGLTALRGDFQAWNRFLAHGYEAGATMGNAALAGHIIFAAVINIAGALQLIPGLRNRFPILHRWNGRLFVLSAFTQAITGLYLTLSGRRMVGDVTQHVLSVLGALLIIFCAAAALRFAMARDFTTHRRWALRLFLVASASWFFRLGFFLTLVVFGPIGFDPTTFSGPLLTFWSLAQYLLPLGVLELYLFAQKHPGSVRRMTTAAVLFLLTLAMGAGVAAVAMASWAPRVKAGLDQRNSIAQTLSATIQSGGMEEAVKQYHELKIAAPATYNFDESELNNLGYRFIRKNKFKEAIRIFQLNVEAYPKSANTYDSLAEGYMDDGENALAIANYQKSLQLNPKNRNAEVMLQKLNVR